MFRRIALLIFGSIISAMILSGCIVPPVILPTPTPTGAGEIKIIVPAEPEIVSTVEEWAKTQTEATGLPITLLTDLPAGEDADIYINPAAYLPEPAPNVNVVLGGIFAAQIVAEEIPEALIASLEHEVLPELVLGDLPEMLPADPAEKSWLTVDPSRAFIRCYRCGPRWCYTLHAEEPDAIKIIVPSEPGVIAVVQDWARVQAESTGSPIEVIVALPEGESADIYINPKGYLPDPMPNVNVVSGDVFAAQNVEGKAPTELLASLERELLPRLTLGNLPERLSPDLPTIEWPDSTDPRAITKCIRTPQGPIYVLD